MMRGVVVLRLAGLCLLFTLALPIQAAESLLEFDTPEQAEYYTELLGEYRCLKCQNQSLSDSQASLAIDLRREIHERVVAGEPKAAIDDYLVARYGDFVLYRPRFTSATLLLWVGPFVLLAIALAFAVRLARREPQVTNNPSGSALDEARELLGESASVEAASVEAGSGQPDRPKGDRSDPLR